jgi:ABC-type amino acid transport substrate-binding protein
MAWCARIATLCVLIVPLVAGGVCLADGLDDVRRSGVLRHLGVPYAGFVMGPEAGLDVELVRRFADHLGVRYSFVQADWSVLFPWLTGRRFRVLDGRVEDLGPEEVRGDLAACGITVLPWRKELADFSRPTFPTQVWLVARSESALKPITPSGDTAADIAATKALIGRGRFLCLPGTCLDPQLYGLEDSPWQPQPFAGGLNEVAPALIKGEADLALLDVPDVLVAMQLHPGRLKVIGPISPRQEMAVAFAKTSPGLRAAFDAFLTGLAASGEYRRLVAKYYPGVMDFYADFFARLAGDEARP